MVFISKYINLFLFIYFSLCECYLNNRYYSVPYIKKTLPRGRYMGFYDVYNNTNISNISKI